MLIETKSNFKVGTKAQNNPLLNAVESNSCIKTEYVLTCYILKDSHVFFGFKTLRTQEISRTDKLMQRHFENNILLTS